MQVIYIVDIFLYMNLLNNKNVQFCMNFLHGVEVITGRSNFWIRRKEHNSLKWNV